MAKTQGTAVAKPTKETEEPSLVTQTKDGADAVADLWYQFARAGQHGSLDALRQFVNVAVPMQGGEGSRRRRLIDGAFAIADHAGAAPLGVARGAIRGMTSTYFDIVVNVNTNVGTNVELLKGVDVDVTVPTNVNTLAHQ
jgi:hypothetical protein